MIRPALSALPSYVAGSSDPQGLKLSSNEASQGPLPGVVEAAAHALAKANRYPDMASFDLRSALAQWLQADSSLPLTSENVAVGAGSSALIQQAVLACCQGGDGTSSAPDEVIYPWRSFEAYPIFAQVAGAKAVEVPLTATMRNDLPALAAAVTERTRLIIVCNPNNPSATTITRPELEEFLAAVPSSVHILLDEAYIEYVREESSPNGLNFLAQYPNLAIARTFSKAFGLAGLRVGYVIGHAEFIDALNKVCIPFSTNAVAQAAAVASIEARAELFARTDDTVAQRERVLSHLPASLRGQTEANFIWLPLGERSREFADALKERHITVRCFDGDGVRITITDAAETDTLLSALDLCDLESFAL